MTHFPCHYRFTRGNRLSGKRAFDAVHAAKVRRSSGPLVVCAAANNMGYCRIGLSVGRRVGTAIQRNRIKRLLRETFRLHQHEWPVGYDLVIIVKPHEPVTQNDYQGMLESVLRRINGHYQRQSASRSN